MRMTVGIISAISLGVVTGILFVPDAQAAAFASLSDKLIVVLLLGLLFFIGIGLGMDGSIVDTFKRAGWRIFLIPVTIAIGTFSFAALSSLVLPITPIEGMTIASGMSWYSLAPAIISKYSTELSAIAFIHNITREVTSLIVVPLVASKIGYIESVAPAGAAGMDVVLPVVERSTNANIAVYSFISATLLMFLIPVITPILASMV